MERNVIIIGGGPAGLTSAIYAARANLSPLVIEGLQPGGQLTITTDIENFPGFAEPISGPQLMTDMHKQAERLGVEFLAGAVTRCDFASKPFSIWVDSEKLQSKAVIVATGAEARWLGLKSEMELRGKGVSACATCDGFFFRGKEVAIVGGGDTAIEEALFLTHFATKVTIIHRRTELRASKAMQKRVMENPKIAFAWNSVVEDILDPAKGTVTGVLIKDVVTGEKKTLPCDGVFLAIGHTPNTSVFKDNLKIDNEGYIVVDGVGSATSVPGVFAAGDCRDRIYRQAITAAGSGCMAAIDAERYLQCV